MTEYRRIQGSTEPEEITLTAGGSAVDLSDADQVELYMREEGKRSNQVSGEALTVTDAPNGVVEFDPAGAKVGGGDAFEDHGRFPFYVRVTWTDEDVTYHPDDFEEDPDVFVIAPNFE